MELQKGGIKCQHLSMPQHRLPIKKFYLENIDTKKKT